jgi:pimeloyl-ACP methyl ester carboxylesterase
MILSWHVYALDFRGQGKSGRVLGGYRSKYYIEDVVNFLEQQLDEPAVLFGQSAGGMVALSAAARCPGMVRALIVGDSPMDMDVLLDWMKSEGFLHYFTALRSLAGADLTIPKLSKAIANIPIQNPDGGNLMKYGDTPGVDNLQVQNLATTLKQLDPGVLEYHASGRAETFLEGFELDAILNQICCPVLLLQGNPSHGGMMTDRAVEHVKSILPSAVHVLLETKGHDLGMDSWQVAPLLRAVSIFLESL